MNVNRPQGKFLKSNSKFMAFVGGYRSGKTWVGCVSQLVHFLQHPKVPQGYFAPTYPQIRDIFYPTIEEVAFNMGLRVDIKQANKEVHVYNGSAEIGTTICRSMDRPSSIVGFKIGKALVDEIDLMPVAKAHDAWKRVIARLSVNDSSIQNGADVTTTPEGFRFVYEKFYRDATKSYGLVRASTYENESNLPDDYIPSLIETYPDELIAAYLNGEFVNLTSGSVYKNFDRKTCGSTLTIDDSNTLYIGQDFNVNHMASVIFIKNGHTFHAVDELTGLLDTPHMLDTVSSKYKSKRIIFYPDSSGNNKSSRSASNSDIALIKSEGYSVRVKPKNPFIKDRVLAVNTAFSKNRLFVNIDKCSELVRSLEQQAYDKNGEPDKSSGLDHTIDAAGYMVAHEMPIKKPTITAKRIKGMY